MRVNLNVPFSRKDEAKWYGAKWDAERKMWYVFTDDASPDQIAGLAQFMPAKSLRADGKKSRAMFKRKDTGLEKLLRPAVTTQTDNGLPNCGCTHVAPWDECDHSGELAELTAEQAAHMRAIAAE